MTKPPNQFYLGLILFIGIIIGCSSAEVAREKRVEYTSENVDSLWHQLIRTRIDSGYRTMPEGGVVLQKETAVKLALAILEPIYGKETIQAEMPFSATLYFDEYWYVSGHRPEGTLGGVAAVILSKKDGKVVSIHHGK